MSYNNNDAEEFSEFRDFLRAMLNNDNEEVADMNDTFDFLSEQIAREQISLVHRLLDEGIIDCRDYRLIYTKQPVETDLEPFGVAVLAQTLSLCAKIESVSQTAHLSNQFEGAERSSETLKQIDAAVKELKRVCAKFQDKFKDKLGGDR